MDIPHGYTPDKCVFINKDGSDSVYKDFSLSVSLSVSNLTCDFPIKVVTGKIRINSVYFDFMAGHTANSFLIKNDRHIWYSYFFDRVFKEFEHNDIRFLLQSIYNEGLNNGRSSKEQEIRKVLGLET